MFVFFAAKKLIQIIFQLKKEFDLMDKYPKQPWKSDFRWIDNKIPSADKIGPLCVSWITGLLIIPVLLVPFAMTRVHEHLSSSILIGLLFLFFIVCLARPVYLTLQYFKFGKALMILKKMPVIAGDELDALVVLPPGFKKECQINLRLVCEKTTSKYAHRRNREKIEIIYKDKAIAKTRKDKKNPNRYVLPVKLPVPADSKTDYYSKEPTFEWKLKLSAKNPGIKFETEFSLPVCELIKDSLIEYYS
jgi:hypothetical protein